MSLISGGNYLIVPQTIGPPATITLHFLAAAFTGDLTQVTSVTAILQRRDETTTNLTFAITSATSSRITATYTFVGGELTTTGAYYLAPSLTVTGGALPAQTVTMYVTSPFAASPKLETTAWILASQAVPAAPGPASRVALPTLPFVEVPTGIGSPARLKVSYGPGLSTLTIASVTGATFTVTRPDGSVIVWNAQLIAVTSISFTLAYVFDDVTDITLPGLYSVGVELSIGSAGIFPANPFQLLAQLPTSLDHPAPISLTPNNPYPIVNTVTIDTATAPWGLIGWGSTGQSQGVGFNGMPVINTGDMSPHLVLHDSTGAYTDFSAGNTHLSLITANEPVRTLNVTSGVAYPANINGECDAGVMLAMRSLALSQGISSWIMAQSTVGQGGQPYSVWGNGGSGNSYQSNLNEWTAQQRLWLAANPSSTYGIGFVLITGGEADATSGVTRITFAQNLTSYSQQVNVDGPAITGQFQPIPILFTQQHSSPKTGAAIVPTALNPPNTTAPAMVDTQDGVKKVLVGPKYQFQYTGDNVHLLTALEYEKMDELVGKVGNIVMTRGKWIPTMPLKITRNGAGALLTYNVPVPPLVFDQSLPLPHQSGAFALWALGQGFEAYDTVTANTGATPAISALTVGATPMVATLSNTPKYASGQTVILQDVSVSTLALQTYVCTAWPITVAGNNLTLVGSTAQSGSFTGGTNSMVFRPLQIMSTPTLTANADGTWTVGLVFDRVPAPDLVISYAMFSDQSMGNNTGGYANGTGGCGGRLRDSDPFVGPNSGAPLPNFGVAFSSNPS